MTRTLDQATIAELRRVLAQAQAGNLDGARTMALQALALGRDGVAFNALLGMLCCQLADFDAAVSHLRIARAGNPDDVTVALNLVTALIETGATDAALEVCTVDFAARDPSLRLSRLRGYLLQLQDDFAGAADAYARVVAAHPDDFESWNNLGNAHAGVGDGDASVAALERAAELRPDIAPVRMNLATTLIAVGRFDAAADALAAIARDFPRDIKPLEELSALMRQLGREREARDALERAATIAPDDADLQVKLGTERVLAWAMVEAETAYRAAIAIDPRHADAHILLGVLLEQTNRDAHFATLTETANAAGVAAGAIHFLRALALRRERRFEEGLAELALVPDDIEPIRQAQMAGQFNDGLGKHDEAFAAFTAMNALQADDPSEPLQRAAAYRDALAQDRSLVTKPWFEGWRPLTAASNEPAPVFLVGFPRSGTTLLDTMLMGHPQVQVLEERPVLADVEQAIGGLARIATIDDAEARALRALYFEKANSYVDRRSDTLLIDKSPLHLNKAPLIHRLFPDARFILALRHPCDVVLSCFITNFRLNTAMSNFLKLDTTAELYDQSFAFWEQCRAILPLAVHEIAYERVVEDAESQLRPLFDYLGLDWNPGVLDHRRTAAERGVISTASYAQVTEPLYRRAAGRWESYGPQLAPVLPLLAPWVARFCYDLQ
uniref:sulfotransferase n=1 Tax=uncultured Sphingomonas sp. TaxID=158754 RepID=UPI0035CAC0F6